MLNYLNFEPFRDQILITNALGRFMFLDAADFKELISGKMRVSANVRADLIKNGFWLEKSAIGASESMCRDQRNAKRYIFEGPSLHIFVVTTRCDQACIYCQAHGTRWDRGLDMDTSIALRSVDIALQSPAETLSFEFQGGEPLLNLEAVKAIVEYTESRKGDHVVRYSLVSNLTQLRPEVLTYLMEYDFEVSTSLDGPSDLHNINRSGGKGSFDDVCSAIQRLRDKNLPVGALQTTTRLSLLRAEEIVDVYRSAGFNSVMIRPLTPLGCAAERWDTIGYTPDEFIRFYRSALRYILELNRNGERFVEGHARIWLSTILGGRPQNYMELRSPCGATYGQMAYYPDGSVYTCDEGRMLHEMGDDSFLLGNVTEDSFDAITGCGTARAACLASITESLPGCCDCVFQPFCGTCPVVNLALYDDLIPPAANHYRCLLYKGMLGAIFEVLQRNDPEDRRILESWIA